MSIVVDAAALMAVLLDEKGSDAVLPVLRGSSMSAVNLAECCARAPERGASIEDVVRAVRRFELRIAAFEAGDAVRTGELRVPTKPFGLSLGDRACLALTERLEATLYTGDRRLAEAKDVVGLDIRLIR